MLEKILVNTLGIVAVLFIAFLFYMMFIVKAGPVNTSKSNSVEIYGLVDEIYEGGVKDVVFKINGNTKIYYINRGLENGFDLKTLQNELIGEHVNFWYAKHRNNKTFHLMQVRHKDSLYYTEWKEPLSPELTSL